MASSPNIAAGPAQDDKAHAAAGKKSHVILPKTTGEKWFDGVRFTLAEAVILTLTATLAYVSRHGKETYFGIPNYLKRMDDALLKKAGKIPEGPKQRLRVALAGTTILFHGGNAFIPIKEWLQTHKESIVTHFNKRFGKPGEVEAGKERLSRQEKETWGDVIKGRVVAWTTVFASFVGADLATGSYKDGPHKGKYKFDVFNEKVGKHVASWTEEGKRIIAENPEGGQLLIDALEKNRTFNLGKILALDVFATTVCVFLWNAVSRLSAMLRKESREEETVPIAASRTRPAHVASDSSSHAPERPFTTRMGARPSSYRALAEKQPVASGIASP